MRLEEPAGGGAVSVGNPATQEFEVCRTSLLPSALKTVGANKKLELPLKLFEVRGCWVCVQVRGSMGGCGSVGYCGSVGVGVVVWVLQAGTGMGTTNEHANTNTNPAQPIQHNPNTNTNTNTPHTQISDVVLLAPEREVGARNERRLVAVVCNREAGFEVIHGLLNRLMEVLGVPVKGEGVGVCWYACACLI